MKIIWMLNFIPPVLSRKLGLPGQASGSWVSALLDALTAQADCPQLVLCGFAGGLKGPQRLDQNGVSYRALPAESGREALRQLLDEEKPDLVQLFGTENDHAQWLFSLFDENRILVYIQGLAGPCAAHMADGLPPRFRRRHPLKEMLNRRTGGLTVRQQCELLHRQGQREEDVLRRARFVLGRTAWDRDRCLALNPSVQYYDLGEIMRPEFYPGGWDRSRCTPHRIFISQGNLPLKGLHRAVQALATLSERWPDVQLYVAGWPPPRKSALLQPLMNWLAEYSGYVENLADELGVADRLHYTGVLDAQGMRSQFLQAETYLLCSSIENSPNSLGEAMLTGTPCAASAVGGVPSMISSTEGVLYDPSQAGSMADAIARLWDNPQQADALADAARQRALTAHDAQSIARRQLEIYNLVFNKPD